MCSGIQGTATFRGNGLMTFRTAKLVAFSLPAASRKLFSQRLINSCTIIRFLYPIPISDPLIPIHQSQDHLEEFASKSHQSTRTTALTLHIHLQRHFASLLNSRLLARSTCNIALALLAFEKLACLSHSHADKRILRVTSLRASASTTSKHLECLHCSCGAHCS